MLASRGRISQRFQTDGQTDDQEWCTAHNTMLICPPFVRGQVATKLTKGDASGSGEVIKFMALSKVSPSLCVGMNGWVSIAIFALLAP